MKRILTTAIACGLTALPAMAAPSPERAVVVSDASTTAHDIDTALYSSLQLTDYTVQQLDVQSLERGSLTFQVELAGSVHTVTMTPHSNRANNFQAYVVGDDGVRTAIEAPASTTLRGTIDGVDAIVAGSVRPDGTIDADIYGDFGGDPLTDEGFTIQPVRDAIDGAAGDLYVVFPWDGVANEGWVCGGYTEAEDAKAQQMVLRPQAVSRMTALSRIELAVDADFQFYQLNSSNENSTIADVENIINRVNIVYERDASATYDLVAIVVRTSSASNPYTTNNPDSLLSQFGTEWRTNQASISRDLAHLFTGRNVSGSTIGIAQLSALCSFSGGYGLSQSRFTTNLASRTALTAHEMGHNCSAPHCDGQSPCNIMCSGLGGCNGIGSPNFAPQVANSIANYIASRPCTDSVVLTLGLPIYASTDSDTLDPNMWETIDGATASTAAQNEPSAPYSINLDSDDLIESLPADGTPVLGSTEPYVMSFYSQHTGVESGKTLTAFYNGIINIRIPLIEITSDGVNQSEFEFHQVVLPEIDVAFNGVRFGFSADGTSGNDDWFVDDIYIGEFQGNPLPWSVDFEGSFGELDWASTTGAAVSTSAIDEPSGTMSANLDSNDMLETRSLLAFSNSPSPAFYIRFFTSYDGVDAGETLRVEYLNSIDIWAELDTIGTADSSSTGFQFHQYTAPIDAWHDGLRLRFISQTDSASDEWYIDDIEVSTQFVEPPAPDCTADLAAPFGTLNFADVQSFLGAFGTQQPQADLAAPMGVFNFADVQAFLGAFGAGCE